MWPWPVTYDLGIKLVRDFIKVNPCTNFLCPYAKWFSCESTNGQTETRPTLLPWPLTQEVNMPIVCQAQRKDDYSKCISNGFLCNANLFCKICDFRDPWLLLESFVIIFMASFHCVYFGWEHLLKKRELPSKTKNLLKLIKGNSYIPSCQQHLRN